MFRNIVFVFSISLIAVIEIVAITPALSLITINLNILQEKIGILVSAFTLPGIILTLF